MAIVAERWERSTWVTWATAALVGGLLIPGAIDVVVSAAQTSGDIALIELRVRDVISTHPPLTGAYSRYGWDHPGPLFSWLAAVPYRALGGGAGALAAVALALNAVGIVLTLRLAAGLGRAAWFALAGVFTALVAGLEPDALASVWNVTVTNVPIVLFAVACWAVWCDTDVAPAGWLALLSGVFVAQSHVGAAVVLAPLGIATLMLVLHRWRARGQSVDSLARPLAVVGVLWMLPAVVDAAVDPPGNAVRLLRWTFTNDEPTVGWSTSARLIGRTSSLTFPAAPRLERGVFLDIDRVQVGVLPGVALVLLAVAGVLAHRRAWRRESVWCAVVGTLWVSAFVAAASITRPLGWWLVQWLEPIGWLTWSAIAVVVWRLVADLRPAERRRRTLPAATAVTAALSVGVGAHAIDVARSHERTSAEHATVAQLVDAADGLDRPVGIETSGEPLLADATLAGVVAGLERRGGHACVEPRLVDKFRDHRICDDGPADLVLRLELRAEPPPAGTVTLAIVDPLDPDERAEADRLTEELTAILVEDGRDDAIVLLGTPLADVILLDGASPELLARADDARRLAALRSVPGGRYALYAPAG